MRDANIVGENLLCLCVCVPKHFTDEQIETFANANSNPTTMNGWTLSTVQSERVPCKEDAENMHVVLNCLA